ncbi:MAG: peptidase M56 [Flavobacterium sp.]|uniref:M56 family metallopeptidase n=1 Tax=Flavobacterium sp. TaxID=239 RepID=UPI0011FC7686|nr:M56 family metallopeptidase [Flavobacterium sp.]RZJ68263.1 MAG: peptidase M56 [Flavobacterium sp.]
METLALYLAKSGALMALFFVAYYLLLRRETFFKSNRWYLLLGLVTSVLLPLVTFRKVVWVDPTPVEPIVNWDNGSLSELDSIAYSTVTPAAEAFEVNWFLVAASVYALITLALIVSFLRDFYSLRKLLKGKTVQRQLDYKFVDVAENVAPFSYFSYIVYNSSLYSTDELINILEHEKVHSAQQHTLDVLIARFMCIAFWWNPFAWLYKKAILQNLEFIADSEAAKKIPDLKSYQFTLLKITTHESCVAVTNHFFQSLIKKRIVMLNKNQSSKWNSWKYLLIVPALAAFLLYFQVKVVAQQRNIDPMIVAAQEGVEVVVDKNTSDAELKAKSEQLKKDHGIKLKFSKVKRNGNGEIIAIKAEFKDADGKKGTTMFASDKPIEPIRFYKENDGAIGFTGNRFHIFNKNENKPQTHISFTRNDSEDDDENEGEDVTENLNFNFDFDFDTDSLVADQKIVVATRNGNKRTVIVNGKEVTGAEADKIMFDIDPVKIRSFSRSKNGNEDMIISVNGDEVFTSEDLREISSQAFAEAQKAIAAARPELERAKAEIKRSAAEIKRAHKEIEASQRSRDKEIVAKGYKKDDMEQARKDIEAAREDIKKAQEEIRKMREELAKERAASGK